MSTTSPRPARTPASASETLSRRALLGAGVSGLGAAALAACADDGPNLAAEGEIVSVRVSSVPLDPSSPEWTTAPAVEVGLEGQQVTKPFRDAPSVPAIHVRSLHDGDLVAFRVDWDDAEPDDATVAADAFRDACAVLLGEDRLGDEIRFMGTQDHPTTLLHWKADWQHDVEHGVRTIDDEFPDRSIDVYPPFADTDPMTVTPQSYVDAGATERLPGLHVGNVLAAPSRSTPVEKTIAWGFRTTTTAPTQDAVGHGRHHDGHWSVVLAKPLRATDPGELTVRPRGAATCAFAIWSGADHDAGGRKSPSARTYRLVLRDRFGPSPITP